MARSARAGKSPLPEMAFKSHTVLTVLHSLPHSSKGRGERVSTVVGARAPSDQTALATSDRFSRCQ